MKKKMTIGIYAPSNPAHIWFKEKYECALNRIKQNGFEIIEGSLIKKNLMKDIGLLAQKKEQKS